MVEALELHNFALVDKLTIELSPGLNVFSGETGAGKSILMNALALLIGERANTSLIREGRDNALIQGFFSSTAFSSASRRLTASGRSTARIDGEVVTVTELAARGRQLVAIHGQHAFQSLLDGDQQRRHLDRLLPATARRRLEEYRATYITLQKVIKSQQDLEVAGRERVRKLDVLRYQCNDIDAADLRPQEETDLLKEVRRLRHAEKLLEGSVTSLDLLGGEEDSVLGRIAEALRRLDGISHYDDKLAVLGRELREALDSIQAITEELQSYLDGIELEPVRLEAVEGRLATIDALKRKYGDSIAAILAYRDRAAAELTQLEGIEEKLGDLEQQARRLAGALANSGAKVREARKQAAKRLALDVSGQLTRLGMPEARFQVELRELAEPSRHGLETVTFLFSANPGERLAPLAEVASGGELSRVMLGLNVVAGSEIPTLAFDEIDAGIGGRAAVAVGGLLKQLAAHHQILVVTHLPQVAAYADTQFFVEKGEQNSRIVTRVTRLETQGRERELARMLSGTVTEASLRNARELLSEAQAPPLHS